MYVKCIIEIVFHSQTQTTTLGLENNHSRLVRTTLYNLFSAKNVKLTSLFEFFFHYYRAWNVISKSAG